MIHITGERKRDKPQFASMPSKSLCASSTCNGEQSSTDTVSSQLKKNPFLSWSLNAWENNLSLSALIPFIRPLIEVKHLAIITDTAVESFIYTFSDKGELFALSSPSPLSKALECLEVSTREVAVYKSHQAKPVIIESISSLGLFLFHICKMFHFDTSCDKVLDFSWTPSMSNGASMHGFICSS